VSGNVTNWQQVYSSKLVSAEAATAQVRNGARIYLGSMGAEPGLLTRVLADSRVEDVEIVQFKASEAASRLAAKGKSRFRLKTFFVGRRRDALTDSLQADYVPLFHAEIPRFFKSRTIPIDVAMIQVSRPDRSGLVSLGVSVDITRSAVESARLVIAQVNPLMPRTHGNTVIPLDRIDYLVEGEEELLELEELVLTDADRSISRFCNELIEDGSVLQTGFAGISQGLTEHLADRRDLGVHTEMFTDSLIDLIEAGVVTNATKDSYRGKSVATFCLGTRRLYDYVHENPLFEFHPSEVVLNPSLIARNERMVAINVAIKVDLRGQIRQGSLGWTAFEGSGGDQDFMRGASLSKNGRSIVCLRSTDPAGNSNIVAHFGPRAAVIMNRGDVQYVITEFGIAYLGGKSIRERTLALLEIAHPDHRESLMAAAREVGYVYPDQVYYRLPSPELRARIRTDHVFKGGLRAHIRAIKSTDESMLRDLFYHLSENSVYFRYFSPRRSMPHKNVQQYLNLEEDMGISIVVTIGPRENRRMIAEGRYVRSGDDLFPDVALMVDEEYQGRGIGTFLLQYLAEVAKERGIEGFRADVLTSNSPMIKILERLPYECHTTFQDGAFAMRFRFDELKDAGDKPNKDPQA
jgi:acyl-CoA hydrolase/GNAT superfamily N-acetyltransferase